MRTPFVPKDFNIPQDVKFNEYFLVPITTKDVIEDWLTLTSNADTIVQTRGGSSFENGIIDKNKWPYICSLEQNFKDLAWLEEGGNARQLFCYILRDKNDSSYAGCIYLFPIETFYPDLATKYDVDFSFWVTKKVYDKGIYDKIFLELYNWLVKDWPFEKTRIFLRNEEIPVFLK